MKRCLILWTGNHIAGSEASQKMKKETQPAVVVPLSAGKVFGMVVLSFTAVSAWRDGHTQGTYGLQNTQLFHMDLIMR